MKSNLTGWLRKEVGTFGGFREPLLNNISIDSVLKLNKDGFIFPANDGIVTIQLEVN